MDKPEGVVRDGKAKAFDVIRDFYDRPPVHATETTFRKLKAILPFFKPNHGGVFLDIACHDGEKTIALQRLTTPKLTVGLDYESVALTEARNRGIFCVAVDLNQNALFPFPDAAFDCIHAGEVIEHLFSPDLLLTEIARLLKPEGYAVITTPNLASWRNRIALFMGWQPFETEVSTRFIVGNPRAPQMILSGHIRMFTAKALLELLDAYGFSVDRMIGFRVGKPNSLFTYLSAMVDALVEHFFPKMCDSIILRVSKKKNPSDAGKHGRS